MPKRPDASATEMADRAGDAFFGHSPGRVAFETRWTHSAYERLHELLWRLPVHWRFYAKHRIFESVEAAVDEGEAASEEMLEGAYARACSSRTPSSAVSWPPQGEPERLRHEAPDARVSCR